MSDPILTEHQMLEMIYQCRSSVKFDLNQMELTAMMPGISKFSQNAADAEANRLRLLLDRINALMAADRERA